MKEVWDSRLRWKGSLLRGWNTLETPWDEKVGRNGNWCRRRAEFLCMGISPGWKSLIDIVQLFTEEFIKTYLSQVWTIVVKTNSQTSENTVKRCCSGDSMKRSCISFWLSGLQRPWQSPLLLPGHSSSHHSIDVLMAGLLLFYRSPTQWHIYPRNHA